ncbi:hypothetical protein PCAR4_40197 [Paraburkholderia caribensis]|nr:hypothetical protein PCAR4_40197 [Paraburkholderia caribensis]
MEKFWIEVIASALFTAFLTLMARLGGNSPAKWRKNWEKRVQAPFDARIRAGADVGSKRGGRRSFIQKLIQRIAGDVDARK